MSGVVSQSQSVLAAIGDDLPGGHADPQGGSRPWTAVFIVASPRPATGKTFIARLVAEFLCLDGGAVAAFDLSPGDVALADQLPALTVPADLDSTRSQMQLFDRLIVADGVAKVVDLGHASFQRFFAVMEQIRFAQEAQRRGLEIVVLYAADAHRVSVQAYSILLRRLPDVVLVPVFNEGVLKNQKLRAHYPVTRAASVPVHIPLLAPALKTYAEQSGYSFLDFHGRVPAPVPFGPAYELRSWVKRTFLQFRELELRLLMDKLRCSLQGS
ncbi:MAG: hypothetical protein IT536_15975 [Hyphomicrobiales bacterium]|nr:hypothetical protein [Hyphomicrobiales bacterium]